MNEAIEAINKSESHRQFMRLATAQAEFIGRYQKLLPDDHRQIQEDFVCDFMYLINLTYREAQEPLVKQLSDFILTHTRPFVFPDNTPL